MALSDAQVEQIARMVAQQMGAPIAPPRACGESVSPRASAQSASAASAGKMPAPPANAVPPIGSPGAFPTVDAAVAAAREAFVAFGKTPLASRAKLIAAIRASMLEHAEDLAKRAHAETGLGRWQDKLVKNRLVSSKTPGTEDLTPIASTGDRGLTLMERAPFGVIAAITPSTNPTSTIICNSIGMLAAGNTVVFNPHPSAKAVSIYNVALINQAIASVGGPPNLITCVAEPTIESAQALMKHPGIRLLVVTGGPGVVQAAMGSGKRAICAGPGNPPVVVDETADIELAGRDIVRGASFDNNVICTDEKEVFVVRSVADKLLEVMKRNGAVVLNAQQTRQLEAVIFKERRAAPLQSIVDRDLIGRNASVILAKIGMNVGDDVRLAVMDVEQDHPLVWTEQLMPVMPVVRVANCDEAIDLAVQAEGGRGHTASMFSRNIEKLSRMARVINCSIFVKNGPCFAGLGEGGEGHTSFSIASPTGEGLTGPRAFSRERRCVLVDHFRIV
ncbi:MAG: aldehyde dehydrogenase EutE [Phycisphaerales bacterium]|nr:aldehyde dehydrogenase EutE [Phycisphaerales bacterium]